MAATRNGASWRFGLPAALGAVLGALCLSLLSTHTAFRWQAFNRDFAPSTAGVVIGSLMIVFAALEWQPWFQGVRAPQRLMPLGGLATGFLGGLTGQQGALRSMFLLKSGIDAPRFIATGVLIAVLIDLARLPTYYASFSSGTLPTQGRDGALMLVGTSCAVAGAALGVRYFRKATIGFVRVIVTGLMLAIGTALILGLLGT